jgi:uncharacterized membrane protein YoaK (UPF0700 family)
MAERPVDSSPDDPAGSSEVDEGCVMWHSIGTEGSVQALSAETSVPPGEEAAGRRRDALLILLTFATGAVDAVSYLGLGQIFTANMTGNVVFLALAVGERSILTALHSVGALIGFCVGALLAGRLLAGPRPMGVWPRRVTWLVWGELACVTGFAVLWVSVNGGPDGGLLYILIGLSSFGMGMQNAAARHLAVPGLTTTVVTTALTGFMVELPALGISGAYQRRVILTVSALFLGAAIGATLMVYARDYAPIVTVATVLVVAVIAYTSFGGSTPTSA